MGRRVQGEGQGVARRVEGLGVASFREFQSFLMNSSTSVSFSSLVSTSISLENRPLQNWLASVQFLGVVSKR